MRLERLKLQNFKCFADLELTFHPSFTVVAGVNGSGKTSVLEAVRLVLDLLIKAPSNKIADIPQSAPRIVREQHGEELRFETVLPITISCDLSLGDGEQSHSLTLCSNAREPIWDKSVCPNLQQFVQVAPAILPQSIQLYYPAARLWLGDKQSPINWNNVVAQPDSRNMASDSWQNASSSIDALLSWLLKQELIRFQEKQETLGLQMARRALLTMMPEAESIEVSAREGQPVIRFKDGAVQPFGNLSDGQKTIFALTTDIARRMCLLNPEYDDEVLTKTSGIIAIDELDVHLHPKWQRRIAHTLQNTFPAIQFICASHSPQILGELPPESVLLLQDSCAVHPTQSLGLDTSTVLSMVMDAEPLNRDVADEYDAVRDLIDKEDYDQAKLRISKLREKLRGSTKEIEQMERLIQRIELVSA